MKAKRREYHVGKKEYEHKARAQEKNQERFGSRIK